MTNISDEAVEAAAKVMQAKDVREGFGEYPIWEYTEDVKALLEAAAPIMLSHERQQTADAHRDAIVNRDTVDKLQQKLDAMESAPPAESVWDEAANVLYMGNAINQDHLKTMWERNPYRSQA